MELIKGISYEEIKKPDLIRNKIKSEEANAKPSIKKDNVIMGMDFSSFNDNDISIPYDVQETVQQPKRQTRKKATNTTGVVPANNNNKNGYSATDPYIDQYQETNALLKTAIAQIDMGLQDMQQDLLYLRSNKTLRNKYQQLSLIQSNMGNFIGNKIQAVRELNNTITKCNDFELKRAKELKNVEDQDDDKRIMELYNAMISMPVGGQTGMPGQSFASPFGPSTLDMTYAGTPNGSSPNIVTSVDASDDVGYNNYLANKSPSQNMMSLDSNPNIQQVIVHNRQTGQSYFEIMDMNTMTPVPNTEKYDNSFLEDTHMDFVNNVGTNVNLGESYPIIQVGSDPILNEY